MKSSSRKGKYTHLADREEGADDDADEEHKQETSVKGRVSLGIKYRKENDTCSADNAAEYGEVGECCFTFAHRRYQSVARHTPTSTTKFASWENNEGIPSTMPEDTFNCKG